jgi:hypothetical protein
MQAFGRKSPEYLCVREEIKLVEKIVQKNSLSFEYPSKELLAYFKAAEETLA